MKTVYFLVIACLFSTIVGCNKIKSDHPQAGLGDEFATDLNAKSIISYADSIDKMLPSLSKSTSLVYMLGDLSFYVERYNNGDKTVLYVEHANNGGVNNGLKKYYLKNDSLILQSVSTMLVGEDGSVFKDARTFLRSNTIFKTDSRTASAGGEIKGQPFIDIPLSKSAKSDKTMLDNIASLNDVLAGNDKFEMVFENITTYPDARYIVLKSKIQHSYSASILVNEKDEFIDSLLNNPMQFKNQKLNIDWTVKDQEAVYVPVANKTSANGLNK
ncbi:MAG: hypothetical protein EOO07_23575 [Chitinophagaceae bacterium]|nr:MAG: hypothetical protein EOO07_23575 [Chitinophagaceae bacterium]